MDQSLDEVSAGAGLNYRAVFEAIGDACLVLNPKFKIVAANSAYCQLTGQSASEIDGRSFFELFSSAPSSELVPRLRESLTEVAETKSRHAVWTDHYPRMQGKGKNLEFWKLQHAPVLGNDGEVAWLTHLVQKSGSVPDPEVLPDRTQEDTYLARITAKLMTPELLHHSRYDMVGLAASTIAHELNQPVTAATNFMRASRRFMELQPPQPGRAGDLLDKALREMQSVSEAIRSLRGVVDKHNVVRELEDLSGLVDEVVAACVERSHDRGITIEAKLESEMPLVLMDRIHIGQVLLNLLRNALDAVGDAPSKRVRIVTEAVKEFVQVTVADSGPGVRADAEHHLFQPFVTTKEQGLGLGLAICKAIIDGHDGEIWGENGSQGGAVFGFRIPANGRRVS